MTCRTCINELSDFWTFGIIGCRIIATHVRTGQLILAPRFLNFKKTSSTCYYSFHILYNTNENEDDYMYDKKITLVLSGVS